MLGNSPDEAYATGSATTSEDESVVGMHAPPTHRVKRARSAKALVETHSEKRASSATNVETLATIDDLLWIEFASLAPAPETESMDDILWTPEELLFDVTDFCNAFGPNPHGFHQAKPEFGLDLEILGVPDDVIAASALHASCDERGASERSVVATRPTTPLGPTSVLAAVSTGGGGGVASGVPAARREWAPWEDSAIRAGVLEMGPKWRAIAVRLPGRSDDAVRNRWARLEPPAGCVHEASASFGGDGAPAKPMPPRQKRADSEPRHSWTAEEDREIIRSVADSGRRWNRIAERLPRRTEHAIRNRWHRLQAQAIDARRETGAVCPVDEPGAAWQASQFLSV